MILTAVCAGRDDIGTYIEAWPQSRLPGVIVRRRVPYETELHGKTSTIFFRLRLHSTCLFTIQTDYRTLGVLKAIPYVLTDFDVRGSLCREGGEVYCMTMQQN